MIGRHFLIGLVLAMAVIVSTVPAPAAAAAAMADAVRMVEEAFDVEVLRARAGEIDGRRVWLLTVMNRGGDFNAAFQVNTLAVDQETGKLVPAFRHGPSGHAPSGPDPRDDKVGLRPDAARSGTWR